MHLSCTLNIKLCLLVITFVSSSSKWQQQDLGCVSPSGKGDCISVEQCPAMEKVLQSVKTPISKEISEQLLQYACELKPLKVCCPNGTINIHEDITKHANYHLLPQDCGYVQSYSLNVMNGIDAALMEYPWMSLLNYRGPDNSVIFMCGGTIINSRYILTAAHCFQRRRYTVFGVRVGEYDISKELDCNECFLQNCPPICNEPVQDLIVEEVITHEKFDSETLDNDIALVRVTTIKFNEKNIRPICLPHVELKAKDAIISGWGATNWTKADKLHSVLQKGKVLIINQTECKKYYSEQIEINERRICAGKGNVTANICHGDSGGPIQGQEVVGTGRKYFQYGIVSAGQAQCNQIGLFTNVFYYMEWILTNMRP